MDETDVVAHTGYPNTQESEAGVLPLVSGHPGLHSKNLSEKGGREGEMEGGSEMFLLPQ